MKETKRRASTLDQFAMHWLLQELDGDDMDVFLKGLPSYIHSQTVTSMNKLIKGLAAVGFLWRITEHFTTCVVSPELSEDARMSRALACADSLQMISENAVSLPTTSETSAVFPGDGLEGSDIETIMKHFVPFCGSPNQTVALRASCVMGLAIQGSLASLERSDPQDTVVRTFPRYLLPLYRIIRSWKTSDVSRWSYISIVPTPTIHPLPSDQEMWSDLLYDAPLINLAVLANAVLSLSNAQRVHLYMPWKTSEALLKAFDVVQVRASPMTQSRFRRVHSRVRSSVKHDDGGKDMALLLDTLDIVARGLRLSEVFACVPSTRLPRNQVDMLFGQDQLRDHNLLEAFVAHLPRYIASTPPDISRALMERIVIEDQLWEKLHVNLSKCFVSTIPFSEKTRIVKTFHDLLDELFVILEGSPNIDWHAPEFDLLIGHLSRYDKEVARGMLVDRSLAFREDLFTSQYCHASLAQFAVLESRGEPLTMYSIGSLIRIFVDLEAGEEEEVKFWGSQQSQGVRAEKMVVSLPQWPLSNFYRLGMLSFDMIQDETGESVSEDVKKTWKLLEKIIDSTLLSMGGASPRSCAATAASGRGREHLLPLLEMIDRVDALPRSAPDEHSTGQSRGRRGTGSLGTGRPA
ncbi:hypothetical protein BC834DRAFT_895197 [Gloeopeniophorella convolvens]|nr:hypothetical protein BC834DRAFT_895197 [Gloeopeniophorella convolvens]